MEVLQIKGSGSLNNLKQVRFSDTIYTRQTKLVNKISPFLKILTS